MRVTFSLLLRSPGRSGLCNSIAIDNMASFIGPTLKVLSLLTSEGYEIGEIVGRVL